MPACVATAATLPERLCYVRRRARGLGQPPAVRLDAFLKPHQGEQQSCATAPWVGGWMG